MGFEGAHGKRVVRGDKDYPGHSIGIQLPQHFKPVSLRQLHIQKNDIRLEFPDQPDRFASILCFARYLDVGVRTKQLPDSAPAEGLVVDDHYAYCVHASSDRQGITIDTRVPRIGSASMVRMARPPYRVRSRS